MPVARDYVSKHGAALGLPKFDETASSLVPDPEQKATLMPITQHPVKLARTDSHDEQTFRKLLAAHPGDAATRAAFAAWLRDRGRAEEADRLERTGVEGPVKLARPAKPGMFTRLKGALLGAPAAPGRTEYDGIVHKGFTKGRIDPDGYAKVVAEKSAVAGALQRLGAFSQKQDPAKFRDKVNLFTEIAHHLHEADHPGLRPVLDHYRRAAEQLNAPDVVSPQPDKPKLGEFPEVATPHKHYTVPNVGPAGMQLTDAAVPLVRAIDRILAATRPGHVPLDGATAPPESTLAGERELTAKRVAEERAAKPQPPVVPDPKLPEGHGDKFRIGLADMRKFKKQNREEEAARPKEMDADFDAKPELPPIPLVNYPGEIGPTGDRYFDINKLVNSGAKRTDIVRHLMDKYALSPRNASAALLRFVKHKSNIGRTFKLNRGWYPGIVGELGTAYHNLLKKHRAAAKRSREKVKPDAWETFHKDVFWNALTDLLLEHGDARAEIFRQNHTEAGSHKEIERQLGPGAKQDWHHWYAMPDGIRLHIHQHSSADGTRVLHRVGLGGDREGGSNYAVFSPEETREFIDNLPHESQRTRIRETTKLARAIPKKAFTGSAADRQIGGSRFAYHLAQIAEEYKGTLLGKAAKYALGLKGRDRLGVPNADSRLAGFDVYSRIGKMLEDYAMRGVAGDVDEKMDRVVRKYQPDAPLHVAFDRLTPAQRAAVAQVDVDSARAGGTDITHDAAAQHYRDRAVARHFLGAYNWDKIDTGLALDRHVANFLRKHIKGAADMTEDTLHTAAHRSFDLDRGAAKSRARDRHGAFWGRLRSYIKGEHGSAVADEKLNESLARLADRAYERRELGADTQKGRDPKPKKLAPSGPTIHGWRDAWGWLPGARHAKFQRYTGGL